MTTALDPPLDRRPTATMRAIVQDAWGSDPDAVLRLAEVERPAAGPGEVLVHVAAASVDMGTVHCMTGMPYAMRLAGFGVRRPTARNPGRALAGTVAAVGAGVDGWAPGDEVWGTSAGSFAEYAVAPAGQLARKPAGLTFEQAAAAPISGVTALQAVRTAGVAAGERVLVLGASGGVGTFAVQLAVAAGAHVTGVSSAAKADLVRSLGAERVVDRATGDALGGGPYDVILDLAGHRRLSALRRALTGRGRLVIVGSETGGRWLGGLDRSIRAALLSPFVRQSLAMLMSKEGAADLDALRGHVDAGEVTPAVDRVLPLAEVAAAIRLVQEGRVRGKVVVSI